MLLQEHCENFLEQMQTDGNSQELFPNDATSIKKIEHGLSNIENAAFSSENKGRRDKALMSVSPQRKKRQIYDAIFIWWYSEEASKLFGLDDNTIEYIYQHLSAQSTMTKICHDNGDYLPLIEGHNNNDDMSIFEREVLTTKIKVLMVAYENAHSAPNK